MSDTQAIFEQVKAIIVDQLGVDADDVTMEASLDVYKRQPLLPTQVSVL